MLIDLPDSRGLLEWFVDNPCNPDAWGATVTGEPSIDVGALRQPLPEYLDTSSLIGSGEVSDGRVSQIHQRIQDREYEVAIPAAPSPPPSLRDCSYCKHSYRSLMHGNTRCADCFKADLAGLPLETTSHSWRSGGGLWTMELRRELRANSRLTYHWRNTEDTTDDGGQLVRVVRSTTGAIRTIVLSTVYDIAKHTRRFDIIFDFVDGTIRFYESSAQSVYDQKTQAREIEMLQFFVLDMVFRSFPPFLVEAFERHKRAQESLGGS